MHLTSLPRKYHLASVLVIFGLYAVLSEFLYQVMGPGAGALAVAPVLMTALFYEVHVIILVWLLCFPLNTLLLNFAGYPGWDAIPQHGGMLGMLMLLILGVAASKMRTSGEQLQQSLRLSEAMSQEIQKRNRELEALRGASVKLTSSLELQLILEAILESASKLVNADDVHVFLYDGQHIAFGAAIWNEELQSEPFREPRQEGVTYTVAQNGTPLFISDVNRHDLFQNWQWGGAIATLPLMIGKQVVGVMNIAFDHPHSFEDNEVRVLQLFADQAAVAIHNARMYEMVQNYVVNLEQHVIDRTAELVKAKDRAEAVLNNSFDAIILFNPQIGIDHVNPAFLSLFGYEVTADVIEQPILSFVQPDSHESFLSTLRTVVATQQPIRQEVTLQDRSGNRIMADVALAPIPSQDTSQVTVICSIRDITHRKQAEERQWQMTQNLRTVLAVANDLLACPDLNTTLRQAVEALRDKLGVERCGIFVEHGDYLQGTYGTNSQGHTTDERSLHIPVETAWLDRYQRLKPEDAQWIAIQADQKNWDGHENHSIGEGWIGITRIQAVDGFRAVLFNDAYITNSPLNETLQEVIVIFCTLLGKIIERRQFEENIQRALNKETELGELKSRFISTISHEFRTPLTVILSSQQLIKLYDDRMTNDKKKQHLQKIEDQVRWMVTLLENVLTISRADKIGLVFNPQPIDLLTFCTDVAEEVISSSNTNHNLVFRHIKVEGRYALDEKLLHTIITNLLSNAVKYSPPESHIYFDIKSQSNQVILTIQDEGIGISEKDLKHLFQEFYRAENTGSIPGTGLGLSIVKRATEAHGGTIHVESKPGAGTTFTVTLKQLATTNK